MRCYGARMNDDWSDETTRKLVQIWNERGHAGAGAHNDNVLPGSKAAVEDSWAQEWAVAAREHLGLAVAEVAVTGSDPPDARATIAGESVSVELVEFVDGGLIRRLKSRNQEHSSERLTSHNDPFFTAAQWTQERFIRDLNNLIDRKQERYAARGLEFDDLVIYSAEPWLHPRDVEQWLAGSPVERRGSFRNVHFLMEYVPGTPGRYPLFSVY